MLFLFDMNILKMKNAKEVAEMAEIQKVLINRLNKVQITDLENPHNHPKPADLNVLAAAIVNQLKNLGYVFDKKDHTLVLSASETNLQEIMEAAKALKGDVKYKVMYPNFPKQVVEASDIELFLNALLHYTGDMVGLRIMPEYIEEVREKLDENVKTDTLSVAFENDVRDLLVEIASQGQPFSEQDLADITTLAENIGEDDMLLVRMPEITVKENLVQLVKMFPEHDFSASFKTVTDVLRLAVAYSDGDVSLAENTKFHLSRKQRRDVLSLLDNVLTNNSDNVEDFGRYAEQWKRLAYHLHYHEYASDRVKKALNVVQSQKIRGFNSRVEAALKNEDLYEVLSLLSSRPGVFARRVAELLRKFPNKRQLIVYSFGKVADKVSVRVLVQMWNHFNGATSDVLSHNVFQVKSRNQKTGVKENTLVGDQSDIIAVIENGLRNRFDKKVYVKNENDDAYVIPMGVRSASSGLRVVGRGSRMKMADDKSTIRMFMHWRDIDEDGWTNRVDLDLSGFFINDDFTKTGTIAYYNLRSDEAAHSGDITSAPDGASEFIDVNIEKALANGWRYVAMTVYSYTGQTFDNIPESWAGVMLRDKPQSGEIFEASTVEHRYDLSSNSRNSTPIVFDLKTREMIWWDSEVSTHNNSLFNVANNESRLSMAMKSLVFSKFMTVDKLLELSSVKVDSEEEAEVVIDPVSTSQVLQLLV